MVTQPASSPSAVPVAPVESDEQLLCPLCDYDLRGLVESRCPECGYTFDWNDLRDPARRKHRYLFEHHPERNLRSFIRTMIGQVRPRKFWTELLPSQPSRPRRLAIYALIIVIGGVLPMALFAMRELSHAWNEVSAVRRDWVTYLGTAPGVATAQRTYPGQSVAQILDQVAPRPSLRFIFGQRRTLMMMGYIAVVQVVPILWVAYTLVMLTILQVSLHKARMRQIHLVRCVIYCADVFLWGQFLAAAGMLVLIVKTLTSNRTGQRTTWWNDDEIMLGMFAWAILGLLPVFWYRLIIAFKKYLHFSHPISTILLTQFAVLLAVLLSLIVITG